MNINKYKDVLVVVLLSLILIITTATTLKVNKLYNYQDLTDVRIEQSNKELLEVLDEKDLVEKENRELRTELQFEKYGNPYFIRKERGGK